MPLSLTLCKTHVNIRLRAELMHRSLTGRRSESTLPIASAPTSGPVRRQPHFGARHKALVTGVACAPSGAPRRGPPVVYAPAQSSDPRVPRYRTAVVTL